MLKNFKCERCGSCCYPPKLFDSDIKRIQKAGYEDFIYTDNLGINYMKDKKDTKCIFLKKKGKIYECSIYSYRPRICRQYPSKLFKGTCKPEKLKFDEFLEKKCQKRT